MLALLPVAFYFIAPLLSGKTGKKATPLLASAAKLPLGDELAVADVDFSPEDDWREVLQQISEDRYRSPGRLKRSRNPFAFAPSAQPEIAADPLVEDEEAIIDADVGEPPTGLRLTGTVVGRGIGLATINGRNYRVHDEIQSENRNRSGPPWIVGRIRHQHVIVARNGQEFRLELRREEPLKGFMTVVSPRRSF